MLRPFFLVSLFLRCFVSADSLYERANDIPKSTITPNVDQIIEGGFTVSVPLSSTATLELDIKYNANKYQTVTVVGPTTFVSVVKWRTSSTASTSSNAGTDSLGSQSSNAAPPSPILLVESQTQSNNSRNGSPSPTFKPTAVYVGKYRTPAGYMAALIEQQYANKSHSTPKYSYTPVPFLQQECVLWDQACGSNFTKEEAASHFFGGNGTMYNLMQDACFGTYNGKVNCTSSLLPPASSALSASVKSYMRQAACTSDQKWYFESINTSGRRSETRTLTDTASPQEVTWSWGSTSTYPPGSTTVTEAAPIGQTDCCGTCQLYGPNVDVFYWPEPSSDDSCLSVIGDQVKPLLEGASTDDQGEVYWGTVTNSFDIYVGTKTTARIVTVNGITVKQALLNPWADDGIGTDMPTVTTTRPVHTTSALSSSTITPPPISVRARPRLIERQVLARNGTSPDMDDSIVMIDGHTFTSPSIYVAFTGLTAKDYCGPRGVGTIPSTILPFAPGELSTIAGHVFLPAYNVPKKLTKVFNFADLPCPPQSVMKEHWYKPAPGEPYRPLIALPEKVRSLDPSWHDCTDPFWFTGLDPPRALAGATQMADPAQSIPNVPPPGNTFPAVCKNCRGPASALVGPDEGQGGSAPQATPAFLPQPPLIPPTPQAQPNKPVVSPEEEAATPPPTLQFGSGKEQTDPNGLSDEEMGQLNQALSPGSNPVAPRPEPQAIPQAPPGGQKQSPPNPPPPIQPMAPELGQISGQHLTPTNPEGNGLDVPKPINLVIGSSTYDIPRETPAPVVNGQPIIALPEGKKQLGGQTLTPGGASVVVDGSTVQVNQQGSPIVNGKTFEPKPSAATKVIDGHTIENIGSGIVKVDGVPIPSQGAVVGGTPVHLAENSLSDGPGVQKPGQPAVILTTLPGGQTVQASNGRYQIQSTPLNAGGSPVVIAGATYSLDLSNSIHVNTQAYGLPGITQPPAQALPTISAQGQIFTSLPNNGGYAVGDTTLLPGSEPVTIGGTPYSLAPSASALVIGSSTIPLATGSSIVANSEAALTAGGQTFTPINPSAVSFSGSTLSIGGPAITDAQGTPISLATGGLVVGSSTFAFATPAPNAAGPITSGLGTLVANGQTITTLPSGLIAVNGATLTPGGTGTTISGTPISVGIGSVVVGGSTVSLSTGAEPTPTTMTTDGQVFTVESDGDVVVGDKTLRPGGPDTTINGTPVSVGTDGVHIGTSIAQLPTGAAKYIGKGFDSRACSLRVRGRLWPFSVAFVLPIWMVLVR